MSSFLGVGSSQPLRQAPWTLWPPNYLVMADMLTSSVSLLRRQIFFEMGFTEMPSTQYVESGFWVCVSRLLFKCMLELS